MTTSKESSGPQPHTVMSGLAFPNGMAVTPDNTTLIVAESFGKRLTAFDIAPDGSLSKGRLWAELEAFGPDGICLNAENREGGQIP